MDTFHDVWQVARQRKFKQLLLLNFLRHYSTQRREKYKIKFNAFPFRDVWQGDIEESLNNSYYLIFPNLHSTTR